MFQEFIVPLLIMMGAYMTMTFLPILITAIKSKRSIGRVIRMVSYIMTSNYGSLTKDDKEKINVKLFDEIEKATKVRDITKLKTLVNRLK